jgi:hypothetical protein
VETVESLATSFRDAFSAGHTLRRRHFGP